MEPKIITTQQSYQSAHSLEPQAKLGNYSCYVSMTQIYIAYNNRKSSTFNFGITENNEITISRPDRQGYETWESLMRCFFNSANSPKDVTDQFLVMFTAIKKQHSTNNELNTYIDTLKEYTMRDDVQKYMNREYAIQQETHKEQHTKSQSTPFVERYNNVASSSNQGQWRS